MHTYPYKHTRKNTHSYTLFEEVLSNKPQWHTRCEERVSEDSDSLKAAMVLESSSTKRWNVLVPFTMRALVKRSFIFVFVSAICVAGADAGAEAAFQAVVIPHIWNECPRLKNTLFLWRSSVPVQEQIQFCKYMSSCRGFRCSMWVDFLPPRMAKAHAMVLVILWGPPYR